MTRNKTTSWQRKPSPKASTLVVLLTVLTANACSNSSSKKATGVPQGASEGSGDATVATPGAPKQGALNGTVTTPDQAAIDHCLTVFGQNPFAQGGYTDYRVIGGTAAGGGANYAIEDTEVTDAAALVLVHAGSSDGSNTKLALMNPNGWYCLSASTDALATLTVALQCNAQLADSQVPVKSSAAGATTSQSKILPTVKVSRQINAEAAPGCDPK